MPKGSVPKAKFVYKKFLMAECVLSVQGRHPCIWIEQSVWNFLWVECLKSSKLEWQIRRNDSPHVEKKISRSFQTYKLGNSSARDLTVPRVTLLTPALQMWIWFMLQFSKIQWGRAVDSSVDPGDFSVLRPLFPFIMRSFHLTRF